MKTTPLKQSFFQVLVYERNGNGLQMRQFPASEVNTCYVDGNIEVDIKRALSNGKTLEE